MATAMTRMTRLFLFLFLLSCLVRIQKCLSFAPARVSVRAARTACDLNTNVAVRRIFAVPSSLLSASDAASTEAAAGDEKLEKKIAARKRRVAAGYAVAAAGYAFFTATALVKYQFGYGACFIAAGIVLPAGLAYILRSAAQNDRLSSDTYKRLNLGLGAYALVGLAARGIITTAHAGWVVTCLVAMVNAVKGFGYGLKGWELEKTPILEEFATGARSTLATLASLPKNFRAAGYQASAVAFAGWTLATLWTLVNVYWTNRGKGMALVDPANPSLAFAFRFKKLLLLQVMAFTLLDAAERERLTGTTFIQINMLHSVASAVMAAYYLHQTHLHQSALVGAVALAVNAFFCGFNGFFPESKKTVEVDN